MSRIHDSLRKLAKVKPDGVKPAYAGSESDCWGMSVADQSPRAPPEPRRSPLSVRLSPEFVNSFCFGGRTPDRRRAQHELACPALLFGKMRDAIVTVRAAKVFPASLSNPFSADSFSTSWAAARSDPELTSLELVGWCAIQQAVDLLPDEIDFHNRHFSAQL